MAGSKKGNNLEALTAASEDEEQEALFSWVYAVERAKPELQLLYHVPNGGKRDYYTARALKRRGVRPGVPDLCLPVARGKYHGLYIELKVGKNTPTEYQTKMIRLLREQGYAAIVCYGWKDAQTAILQYLKIDNKK